MLELKDKISKEQLSSAGNAEVDFEAVTSGITVELQSTGGGSFSRLGNVIIGRLHLRITGSPDADGWYKFRLIIIFCNI